MAISNFIPEIWSAKIFQDYDKNFVFGNLVNRNYEGEVAGYGDRVKINAIGAVTVNSYTKNSTINAPQELIGADATLVIDQADYFNFAVDDVDKRQQQPKVMGEGVRKAAVKLAETADYRLAGCYVNAGITLTTAAVGPTGLVNKLAEIHRYLDDNDVPYGGRWIVVPPWFYQNMVLAGLGVSPSTNHGVKNIDATDMFRSGLVGDVLGLTVFKSNNLVETANSGSTGKEHYILAGNNDAITYADNIVETEAYRPPDRFADAVKGLHVYGYKVVQPKALICAPFAESTV